ncbi:potassium-transporting ATPase subunit C [Luteolibacter soli]|uniref:Potassium-transporting ATPase subunit C n=1 Tax=Luteolibacter soli TaxID=3135280 RepID=A0ABU9AYF4_9BACT
MKRPLPIPLRVLRIAGIAAVAGFAIHGWDDKKEKPPIPDEKRVAMIDLEDKQSGPGYFHADSATQPDENGIRWLEPDQAKQQIDRVLHDRKLDESNRKQLAKLIGEVSEPYPSRTIGGNRINIARLNVALDAMPR